MAFIDIERLTFSYGDQGDRPVLNDVSLSIEEGELLLLCGASASGKTTLLRLIKHLIAPYGNKSGTIYMNGTNIEQMSERELVSKIGFVFQNPDHQIVCEEPFAELAFGLENLGVSSNEIRHRVAEMANFFGIQHFFTKNVHALSGGQKQLLNLAAIMVMQPDVLILDEPTAMLDPICTDDFLNILKKLNEEMGLTIILCEHHLDKVYSMADKVCILDKGSILFSGDAKEGAGHIFRESISTALSMPAASKLYMKYDKAPGNKIPLTVKEGRGWLNALPPSQISEITEIEKTSALEKENKIPAFHLKKVFFRYDKKEEFVLNNLNLTGFQNEILTVVGGNGSGKSTLLSVLSGYRNPTLGKVIKGKTGYMPQDPSLLFSEDTVEEVIANTLSSYELDIETAEQFSRSFPSIRRILSDPMANPLDLSGGQKQLLAFYKLALLDLDCLILDEPVKGLDGLAKKELADILTSFAKKGVCVLMVTHDLEFAAMVSDRIGMLFQGEIISLGSPVDFFSSNHFYTTSRCKIGKGMIPDLI